MTLHPILVALRRHKAGVVLIALQIALTLAIVCNAVFIIGQRVERIGRPTGLHEKDLFMVEQTWVGAPTGDDAASIEKLDALQREDLATLRQLPDVVSVAAVNTLPLTNNSWGGGVNLKPDHNVTARSVFYFGDEQLLATLGLKLIAGRAFSAGDIVHQGFRDTRTPPVVIVSKPLADSLFPHGDALGKTVFLNGGSAPTTIIGIVARLQSSSTSWSSGSDYNSAIEPMRLDASFSRYVVRTRPGRERAVMAAARDALYAANPMRVISDDPGDNNGMGIRSFAEIRDQAYRADKGMAILMGVICLILLGVTAAGIVGLTSFWVGQRHRQIGVRRALGARKVDILRYFQIENGLIAGAGVVLGVLLALGLNQWLMTHFEMTRMPLPYLAVGVLAVLALGQAAVFAPARRASNVPPVVATRSV